jgi:alpha-L-rhamnosidase
MRLSILVLLSCLSSALSSYAQLNVSHLRTENLTDPLGLDCLQPRLSWVLESPDRGVLQTAYELRVDTRPDGGGHFWSTTVPR